MNTRKFAEAISMVDDKYYMEAANYQRGKKAAWRRWEALAACLCLAAVCVFAAHLWGMPGTPTPNPNGTIQRGPEPDQYPPADIVPGFTLDEPGGGNAFPFVFNDVGGAPVEAAGMIALLTEDFCPMSAEESLDYFGVKFPEDGIVPGFQLTGGGCFGDRHGIYRSGERGVYFDVNSYEFTDGGGKSVTLTLRTLFNMMPSPQQVKNGPEHIEFTEFKGWDLALFRYTDEDGTLCVYTEFALDGVTYTLSASGPGNNGLAAALMSLLPRKERVPDPTTVTGTVTRVDSRRNDYFDGVKHHYSEDHDFIEVDCGGARLTVWLPGEADRFRAGDSVTVTYNGEPATVRNIWPGQLVSVE